MQGYLPQPQMTANSIKQELISSFLFMFLLTEEFLLWGKRKKANTWSSSNSPGKEANAEQQLGDDLLIKLHSLSTIQHPCTNKKKQTALLAPQILALAVNSPEYIT